jgi:hypothetical protein
MPSFETPPAEFVCPLTKKLIKEPIMSRYGNHFERTAILDWLNKGNNYCPVTGNPLRPSMLVSDKTLQWKINYWAKKHGHEVSSESQSATGAIDIGLGYISVPQERFICPLTNEIMEDPVMTREGLNFERKAILKWLDEKGVVCPISGKKLKPSGLVTNNKLQWEIRQWQLHDGDSSKEMTRLELESKLSKAAMISQDFGIGDILRALTMEEEIEESAAQKEAQARDVLSVIDDVINTL